MSIINIGSRGNAPRTEPEIEPRPSSPPFGARVERPTGQPRTATLIADELDAIDGEAKTIAQRLVRLAVARREREEELLAVCSARKDQAKRIFDEADRVLRHYFGERCHAEVQGATETNPQPPEADRTVTAATKAAAS
jgi:hypothetical protein